jgi:hypothetical protein
MPPVAPTTRIGADEEAGEESAAEIGQRAQSWRRTSDAAATAAAAATPPPGLGNPKRSGRRRQWWQRLLIMARSRGYSTVEVWGLSPQNEQPCRSVSPATVLIVVTVTVVKKLLLRVLPESMLPDLATSPVPTVYPIPNRAGLVGELGSATPTNASEFADH